MIAAVSVAWLVLQLFSNPSRLNVEPMLDVACFTLYTECICMPITPSRFIYSVIRTCVACAVAIRFVSIT